MKSFVVIPARLESTRLPRKLLLDETGKPLILHTVDASLSASRPDGVIVATDSQSIADVVHAAGFQAVMTDSTLPSGTDRVGAVAKQLNDCEIVVNVQGDEPEIQGSSIDTLIGLLESDPDAQMATLATPIRNPQLLDDPASVKVVFDQSGSALYFSRSRIPFPRVWDEADLQKEPPIYWLHVGIYAYRRDFLLELIQWERTPAERVESLEQLRVLENGAKLKVGRIDDPTRGIDTVDDYRSFVSRNRS